MDANIFEICAIIIIKYLLQCCWANHQMAHMYQTRDLTTLYKTIYTRRQINFYRMFLADFSVYSQPILMKFCKDCFRVTRRLPLNFHKKILHSSKVRPFDMYRSKFVITQSLYKPINLEKLKFVFSPELHHILN